MEIIPAILEKNWTEIENKLKLVDGLTEYIQLDVSDGVFTPVKTWSNPADLLGLNFKSKIEVHLMVTDPMAEIAKWSESLASRFVVQVESLKDVQHLMLNMGKEIVLGFKVETLWQKYEDFFTTKGNPLPSKGLPFVNRVLFLSVNPGYQGQEFNESVLEKIKTLKSAHPDIKIEVDGGINLENISKLKELGVDSAVVGSAIFDSADPKQVIDQLKAKIA